jgi:hypothetical protein
MKKLRLIAFTLFALALSAPAFGQFTIEETPKQDKKDIQFKNELVNIDASTQYYSAAKARAERARIRNERNTLEITGALQGSLTSYNEAWTKSRGGDNTITVLAKFNLKHTYTKERFSINTQVDAKYGYNRIKIDQEDGSREGVWFKNIDEFWLQTQPQHKLNDNWAYSAMFKLKSQFSTTYKSRSEQEHADAVTGFMSPGTMDLSVGMTYSSTKAKFPIKISLNPLSGNGVVAINDDIRNNYKEAGNTSWFGVDIDKNFLFTGGSSVKVEFARKWGKNEWFAYDTNLYCYYGWITNVARSSKIDAWRDYENEYEKWQQGGQTGTAPVAPEKVLSLHPTVEWRNTLTFKASKFFSTQIYFQLNYDKAQNSSVQMYSMLTLGLTYTFKNK